MSEEITTTKTLDVCGKICPYPDMDTMTTLKKMAKGRSPGSFAGLPACLWSVFRAISKSRNTSCFRLNRLDGPNHRMLIEAYGLK